MSDRRARRRPGTATSSFGVGRRESHDASYFYARFGPPQISRDSAIVRPRVVDELYVGDARRMDELAPASVALVVTSPPYFSGKEYERALGERIVPASYFDYLEMLHEVFAECVTKLEPGGRMAVNVANLGRKPFRSLAADVTTILQDRLGLLLRGEIVWHKARGAGGSCAWGSFQSPANPVLRDLTERVIVASKGRFDRAPSRRERARRGWPSEASLFKDEFMEATTDVWEIAPERATRVGHPAPFPVELPLRLIHLYTYRGDLVLDPFVGSGSAAVAAVRAERHFVGYDTDPAYVARASERVEAERRRASSGRRVDGRGRVVLPASGKAAEDGGSEHVTALREGRRATEIARAVLHDCGFVDVVESPRLPAGVEISYSARDATGRTWLFDVAGSFTTSRSGLRRVETLWRSLGKAAVLRSCLEDLRLVLLATDLPPPGSAGEAALSATRGRVHVEALEMLSPQAHERLRAYARGEFFRRQAAQSVSDGGKLPSTRRRGP